MEKYILFSISMFSYFTGVGALYQTIIWTYTLRVLNFLRGLPQEKFTVTFVGNFKRTKEEEEESNGANGATNSTSAFRVVTDEEFASIEGKLVLLGEFYLNKKQAAKFHAVMRHEKEFMVFRNFLVHHGCERGSLNSSVEQYLIEHPKVKIISCWGNVHPFRKRHVAPTNGPLVVKYTLGSEKGNVHYKAHVSLYAYVSDII